VSVLKFSLILVMFLVFASQSFVFATSAQIGQEEAASALANAEGTVVSAFQEVLKAEEAGANVSFLLARLNEAEEHLTQARIAYRLGDFDETARFSGLSREVGEQVQSDAIKLRDSALSESLQHIMFTMIASVAGVALITLGSLWVWHLLKKRYGNGGFLKSN